MTETAGKRADKDSPQKTARQRQSAENSPAETVSRNQKISVQDHPFRRDPDRINNEETAV